MLLQRVPQSPVAAGGVRTQVRDAPAASDTVVVWADLVAPTHEPGSDDAVEV